MMDVNQVLDDLKRSMPTPGCSIQPVLHHFTLCTAVSDAQPVAGRTTRRRLAGRCCQPKHTSMGVRVISRFDWSKLPARLYEQHPDWFFVNAEGQPQVYNELTVPVPVTVYRN